MQLVGHRGAERHRDQAVQSHRNSHRPVDSVGLRVNRECNLECRVRSAPILAPLFGPFQKK